MTSIPIVRKKSPGRGVFGEFWLPTSWHSSPRIWLERHVAAWSLSAPPLKLRRVVTLLHTHTCTHTNFVPKLHFSEVLLIH